MSIADALGQALIWYAVASALAVLLYPVVFRATPGLPDRGLSLARPLGLLLTVGLPWWVSAGFGLPFTTLGLIVAALALGLLGWAYEARRGEIWATLRSNLRTLLALEALCLTLYLGYVLFRGYNPDIAFTEKPMDFAFLTSAIRSTQMPPPDPWFAGEPINYYYLGYVLMGSVARLSRTVPAVAFNLALATLFAYSATVAAGTAANLVRANQRVGRLRGLVAGGLGVFFLVGIGNLVASLEFIKRPAQTLDASWWQGVGWKASRVIVDEGIPWSPGPHQTINEFPAFSYVLGDLHPHVLAQPWFLTVVGLAFGLTACAHAKRRRLTGWLPEIVAGMVVGALYAINSWDMPTALLIVGGAIVLFGADRDWRSRLGRLAVVIVAAGATAFPFALHYTAAVGVAAEELPVALRNLPVVGFIVRTIGVVVWPRSGAGELLTIYGAYLMVIAVAVAALWSIGPPVSRRASQRLLIAGALTLVVAALVPFWAAFFFALPLVLLVWLLGRMSAPRSIAVTGGLLALACGLILIPELFFLQDAFANRMNTVFKVYFQVWGLLAIASAAALPLFFPLLRRRFGNVVPSLLGGLLGVLLLGSALYPPLSAAKWTNDFDRWQGLDGLAYVADADPAERVAIDWLRQNASPGSVVLEAPGCSYGAGGGLPDNRVSMATGLSAVIGWSGHEYQWRTGEPGISAAIQQRQTDVNTMYEHPTSTEARRLLARYDVAYIYVGRLERVGLGPNCTLGAPYPPASLDQLGELGWPVVFAQGDVRIYARPAVDPAQAN